MSNTRLFLTSFMIAVIVSSLFDAAILRPKDTPDQKVVELHITMKEQENPPTAKHKIQLQPVGQTIVDGKAICSGFFIDDHGDIMTARHCTDIASGIEVVTSDGRKYEASFTAKSAIHDLALIHIDRLNTPYFKAAKTVTRGEAVFFLGSPMGLTGTLVQGIVANLYGDVTLIDNTVIPGNSGGAVFDKNGRLVGVITAVFVTEYGMAHLGVAQGIDSVRSFIGETKLRRKP